MTEGGAFKWIIINCFVSREVYYSICFSSQPFVEKKRQKDDIFRGLCLYWTFMHLMRLSLIKAQSGPYDVMIMTSQRPELQQYGREWRKSWSITIKMPITLFEIELWKFFFICSFCFTFVQQWWDIILFFYLYNYMSQKF